MKRRLIALAAVAAFVLPLAGARADAPLYEAGVFHPEAGKVISGKCEAESSFDVDYDTQRPAAVGDNCVRLKVVFGPIWAKPGQNDVLIQPVTIEKPMYDGYMVRFKPDLVGVDPLRPGAGASISSPPVEDLHLHHGTWLNPGFLGFPRNEYLTQQPTPVPNPARTYGWGPWLATGEEKTVVLFPEDVGLKIKASDAWLFLHMVHNATPRSFPVWVTYDIDYIAADAAEAPHPDDSSRPLLYKSKGIWLDVGDCGEWSETGCQKDQFNPIFNIQRGFGHGGTCIFPRQNCANQNTFTGTSTQQGIDKSPVWDEWTIPEAGTLVMMGGHLHNGGLRADVYLVRDGEERLIHNSDAYYFDHDFDPQAWAPSDVFDPGKSLVGGPPTSWDFVMTGVTKDVGWAVNVRPGDKLRLEGIYDSSIASWYEQMGIVMSWILPLSETGEYIGVDPFDPSVTINQGVNTMAVHPGTVDGVTLPGSSFGGCTPGATVLCTRGQMTHARVPTSGNHTDPCGNGCQEIARTAPDGDVTTDIYMGGFTYGQADFSVIGLSGVPVVPLGESVAFHNADTADYMWHTATRCANPCSGTTVTQYPIADGAYDDLLVPGTGETADGKTVNDLLADFGPDPMDFDSGQLGYGTGASNELSWTLTPTRTGTFTFWCRIHPSMRGAIRVVA